MATEIREWNGVPVGKPSNKQILLVVPDHGICVCTSVSLFISRFGEIAVSLAELHVKKASHRKAVARAFGYSSHADAYEAWHAFLESEIQF
ncbi:hypothetical protein [Pseudomonas caricapapayae]|uniref:hypothetical protein n=1 Tax=Pseudomonas caricapapayae TaxID=46678 RepID=UPI000EFE494F|nr:hypothetical protein [Pseudomonas caricapapayae]